MTVATLDHVPVVLAKADARALVDQINDGVTSVWFLVIQAYSGRAWVSLGYDSWDALCDAELRGARLRLSRDERQDVVARLHSKGLSTRAIESAIGISRPTIISDLRAQVVNSSPPAPVVGMDGKTYAPTLPPRPAAGLSPSPALSEVYAADPPKPKPRAPFTQTAEEARIIGNEVWSRDLAKCVFLLAGFGMHPGQAPGHLTGWDKSQDVYAEPTTPARLRQAATYLADLADAWEAQP